MEAWNLFRLFICVTPYFYCLQALVSSGYAGCFEDDVFPKGTWFTGVVNNGTRCIRTCGASGYIFAATKSNYCICDMIYFGSSKRGNCVYKCPGFQNEICGGPDSISVYDIRLTDVKLTPPAQTDALVTSTESINSFTEQTAYNKVIDTKSSDGLITSTESNNNFTEQTAYNEADVQATITSTTPNSTMETTSEIMSTEQIDHNTAAVQTTFRSTTSNGTMEITFKSASISTEQADLNTGRRTDDLVSVYISVPVLITPVAALTGVIVFCLKRKSRHTDDRFVLFRRKMVTRNTHLFNTAANKTYNGNTSNDDSNCSKYSSKTVQNSSASLYAEIAFGSTETLETSENGYSTVSIGLLKGKNTKDVTESSDTYDTLHTGSKANAIKTSDCFQSVYDHVIVGNHNNQSTDSDEYSHLHTVQINNLQQTYSKIIDNHHIDEDRTLDTNSVHCGIRTTNLITSMTYCMIGCPIVLK